MHEGYDRCMSVDGVLIRDALPAEIAAAGAVVRSAYLQYEADYPRQSWSRFIEMVGDLAGHVAHGQVIVAVRAGEVIGSVTFYVDGGLSGQGEWPAGWGGVLRLGVLPAARGLGLGRALMEECIARAKAHELPALGLHTTAWMAVARAMYERMGFVREASFDFYPRSGIEAFGYRLDLKT
jgi:ribosomal protein S18 acetylase RimI-like enzyme